MKKILSLIIILFTNNIFADVPESPVQYTAIMTIWKFGDKGIINDKRSYISPFYNDNVNLVKTAPFTPIAPYQLNLQHIFNSNGTESYQQGIYLLNKPNKYQPYKSALTGMVLDTQCNAFSQLINIESDIGKFYLLENVNVNLSMVLDIDSIGIIHVKYCINNDQIESATSNIWR